MESALQPPSGGCVLKQEQVAVVAVAEAPAAFGRLCVETSPNVEFIELDKPSRLRAAVC